MMLVPRVSQLRTPDIDIQPRAARARASRREDVVRRSVGLPTPQEKRQATAAGASIVSASWTLEAIRKGTRSVGEEDGLSPSDGSARAQASPVRRRSDMSILHPPSSILHDSMRRRRATGTRAVRRQAGRSAVAAPWRHLQGLGIDSTRSPAVFPVRATRSLVTDVLGQRPARVTENLMEPGEHTQGEIAWRMVARCVIIYSAPAPRPTNQHVANLPAVRVTRRSPRYLTGTPQSMARRFADWAM
ncbi:hypothetical protein VTN02DRAFT_5269 [Thermoascus thermophilus]